MTIILLPGHWTRCRLWGREWASQGSLSGPGTIPFSTRHPGWGVQGLGPPTEMAGHAGQRGEVSQSTEAGAGGASQDAQAGAGGLSPQWHKLFPGAGKSLQLPRPSLAYLFVFVGTSDASQPSELLGAL